MDEVTLLDSIDWIVFELGLKTRPTQICPFGLFLKENRIFINLWTKEDCDKVRTRLKGLYYEEVTIRKADEGFVLAADCPGDKNEDRVRDIGNAGRRNCRRGLQESDAGAA